MQVVNVCVDGAPAHFGALSYLMPQGREGYLGQGVQVPYGSQKRKGVVVGPGEADKATKQVIELLGDVADVATIQTLQDICQQQVCELPSAALRLTPSLIGPETLHAGPVELKQLPGPVKAWDPLISANRYLYLAGGLSLLQVAQHEIIRLSTQGQVLVLCPTQQSAQELFEQFTSGAALLVDQETDQASSYKGFLAGSVQVAIGTSRIAGLYGAANLVGVIILDEANIAHLATSMPHIHGRDLAAARAKHAKAELVVISHRATAAGLGLGLKLQCLDEPSDWPGIHIVDRTNSAPGQRDIPSGLVALMKKASKRRLELLVVLSKQAVRRSCANCRQERPSVIGGIQKWGPEKLDVLPCNKCGSQVIRYYGWDKARVQGELEPLVASKIKVVTLAKLESLPSNARCIVVIDIDPALKGLSVVGEAPMVSLTGACLAAAGRDGDFIVVTAMSRHQFLVALSNKNLKDMANYTWNEAKQGLVPPFSRLIELSIKSKSAPNLTGMVGTVHGPVMRGAEWYALVRCQTSELTAVKVQITRLKQKFKMRWTVK